MGCNRRTIKLVKVLRTLVRPYPMSEAVEELHLDELSSLEFKMLNRNCQVMQAWLIRVKQAHQVIHLTAEEVPRGLRITVFWQRQRVQTSPVGTNQRNEEYRDPKVPKPIRTSVRLCSRYMRNLGKPLTTISADLGLLTLTSQCSLSFQDLLELRINRATTQTS